ncbi:MAG: hypothetical protein M3Q07_17115 [Pseudobdellovibrionaceae bacterium]|nr:hypothetical protein [Pseudobdellovibrionaceae bacterium]
MAQNLAQVTLREFIRYSGGYLFGAELPMITIAECLLREWHASKTAVFTTENDFMSLFAVIVLAIPWSALSRHGYFGGINSAYSIINNL